MLYARSIRKNILYGLEAENGIPPEEVSAACQRYICRRNCLLTALRCSHDVLTYPAHADSYGRGHYNRH